MEVHVHRKDRQHPIAVREYFDEVYQPPRKSRDGKTFPGPWQTHTKRMLRHKTMIQGFRVAFGFAGIYDDDEAERIVVGQLIDGQFERDPGAALAESLLGSTAETGAEVQAAETQEPAGEETNAEPEPGDAEPAEAKGPTADEIAKMVASAKTDDDLNVCRDLISSVKDKAVRGELSRQLAKRAEEILLKKGGKAMKVHQ